jgi:hypothetical protein
LARGRENQPAASLIDSFLLLQPMPGPPFDCIHQPITVKGNIQQQNKMADARKNIIPVRLGDFSVLDTEFSSIRERFDAEMRKMEDEMTKFRSELLNREQSSLFSRAATNSR